jgi:hypothetical protein
MSIKAKKSIKTNHNVVDIVRRGRYAMIEDYLRQSQIFWGSIFDR